KPAYVRASRLGVPARAIDRHRDDVDAGGAPALQCAPDRIVSSATADIEHPSGWQRLDEVLQGLGLILVLPRSEAEAVHDLVLQVAHNDPRFVERRSVDRVSLYPRSVTLRCDRCQGRDRTTAAAGARETPPHPGR